MSRIAAPKACCGINNFCTNVSKSHPSRAAGHKRKSLVRQNSGFECPHIQTSYLEEAGRLHFFYHSPDSHLPVRDVLNRHRQGYKTEPYLEKSSENYCQPCIPNNIRGFLKSNEKYLFLLTKRSNKGNDKRRYIVGYLTKKKCLRRLHLNEKGKVEYHLAVKGPITLVSFADAFLLSDLSGMRESSARRGFRKLDKEQVRLLMDHFATRVDIFPECLREVRRLNKLLAKEKLNASCSNTRRC